MSGSDKRCANKIPNSKEIDLVELFLEDLQSFRMIDLE